MVRIIIVILMVSSIYSCFDKPLTISKGLYNSECNVPQLKLNGYYFHYDTMEGYRSFILHKNGVLQYNNDYIGSTLINNDKYIINSTKADPKEKLGWGIFNIKDDMIEMQYWIMPSGSGFLAPKFQGSILNDSTFYIESRYSSKDTFHFRRYHPKPDSTNQFIK